MYCNPDELAYSEWWNKLIQDVEIADLRYELKGFFVWKPYGFSIMKRIQTKWDRLFNKNGIQETYFPLLVPEEYASRNKSWWESFKQQAFYANGYFGEQKRIFLRPTGEPAMYPMFSIWIRSHRDLPFRIYQTVRSYRNETKSTKTLARDVEIGPWYEIHTCHASLLEAEKEIELAIQINEAIFDYLAVATIKVRKPQSDCFPGSVGAVEFYTLMNNQLIENGSCNNLGQAYAKAFDISFVDDKQQNQYVWQTCTGNGERFLSAVIANHADKDGLVLPPRIAPIQAALVTILVSRNNLPSEIFAVLKKVRFNVFETASRKDLGNVRFYTEKRGIPVRIEIGPKELGNRECFFSWRNGNKKKVAIDNLETELLGGLRKFQNELLEKSKNELHSRIKECDSIEEAKAAKIALIGWCGKKDCSDWIKHETEKEVIGMTFNRKEKACLWCKSTGEKTYISQSY